MDCAPYPAFRTPHTCPWGEPGARARRVFLEPQGRAKVPPSLGASLSPPMPHPREPFVFPHPRPVPPPLETPTDLGPVPAHQPRAAWFPGPHGPSSALPAPAAGPAYCPGPGFQGAGPAGSACGSRRLPAAHPSLGNAGKPQPGTQRQRCFLGGSRGIR